MKRREIKWSEWNPIALRNKGIPKPARNIGIPVFVVGGVEYDLRRIVNHGKLMEA